MRNEGGKKNKGDSPERGKKMKEEKRKFIQFRRKYFL